MSILARVMAVHVRAEKQYAAAVVVHKNAYRTTEGHAVVPIPAHLLPATPVKSVSVAHVKTRRVPTLHGPPIRQHAQKQAIAATQDLEHAVHVQVRATDAVIAAALAKQNPVTHPV